MAERFGLDPDLVAAIILKESSADPYAIRYEPGWPYVQTPEKFKPQSCSVETERRAQMMSWGLMQVMGTNIRTMGYTGWLTEYLDPSKAIEVGCRFLAGLLKHW
ncbi:MAG: transglycosylase SLT domain-containing protein, partial [Thermodesulfobacteriota bacterium]